MAGSLATISRLEADDEQVTVTVVAGAESDVVYVRYRKNIGGIQWAARDETFKRTGSGDIIVTGLSNGTDYMFSLEATDGVAFGDWSEPKTAYPDSDPNSTYRHNNKIYQRNAIALAALQVAQQQGERIVFKNEGAGATNGVTVYGVIIEDMRRNVGIRSGSMDLQGLVVSIPRQTSFPPDNFNLNSAIEVDGEEYQVQTYSTSPNDKTYAAVWTLECESIRGQENY